MTHRLKPAFTLTLSLLLAFGLTACALPSPVPEDDGTADVASNFTVNDGSVSQSGSSVVDTSDMAGNAVRLSAYPSRIVVLDPADCEILFAIGAGDSVVGRTASCDYPSAETSIIPYVTTNNVTDADLVLLREPDLVIMSAEEAADAELVAALNSAGIVSVVTNASDVNNMYGAISLLGTVTNHTTEANALLSQMITSFAELQTKISSHSETVYLELSSLADGLTTAGSGTIFTSLITLLGYHNEFEDQSGYPAVTQDQVIGRSPDIIITTNASSQGATSTEETPDPALETPDPAATESTSTTSSALTGPEEILAREGWADVDAVKNGRVYYIPVGLLTRAGPRILDAIDALYTALYESKQPQFE